MAINELSYIDSSEAKTTQQCGNMYSYNNNKKCSIVVFFRALAQ